MPRSDVVVTAFEPFGGRRRNRSLDAVRRLDLPGVETRVLPTVFERLHAQVPPLVEAAGRALILVGESQLAHRITLERIAVNLIDARLADNEGARPRDVPVLEGGPAAYFATWPATMLAPALAASGIPAELSAHAGTFACNAALYLALHHAAALPAPPRIGFLHVPARWWYADDARATRALAFLVARLRENY